MPAASRHALFLLCSVVIGGASLAQRPLEPDAQFDRGNVELARFVDSATDVLVEAEAFTARPKSWLPVTSQWLRTGCSGGKALAMRTAGEASLEITIPTAGRYTLWVRSHGAAGRRFAVWVGGQRSQTVFGDRTMCWRDGGAFELKQGPCRLRITEVNHNPYCDCLLLTRDAGLHPEQLAPLRAFAGDERWARVGEAVVFDGGYSMGRIAGWRWEFGDGSTRDGKQVGHTYQRAGDYQYALTIRDRAGQSGTRKEKIHVFPAIDYTVRHVALVRGGQPRFGDLNGDGRVDFLASDPFRFVDAYLHDGTRLWTYDSPESFPTPVERREHPMVIWDFDGDGKGKVAMWRFLDGREWLCLCDGMTGTVRKRVPWPVPEGYVNARLAVGNLTGRPDGGTILMFNGQYGGDWLQQADAYDADLNRLWSYGRRGPDILGHYVYSCDVTDDAREEVFVSAAMIRPDGAIGWERTDLRGDHADSIRLGDINEDGKVEVAYCYSNQGVYVLDAATGRTLWHKPTNHAQQIEIADVCPDAPGVEVIVGDRFYIPALRARLLVFDCRGRLLTSFPEKAVMGNPNLGVLEWDGVGAMEIAWSNMVVDGRGAVLAVLPWVLDHAFDFAGDGKEEFITVVRDAENRRRLAAYGARGTDVSISRKTDYETRRKAANHSHY